jgi:hypothetical protein
MTNQELNTIKRLIVGMPYLGGNFTPIRDEDPVTDIISNLENLKEALEYAATRSLEKDAELKEYRKLTQAIRMVGQVMTN